jgi:hypothetical protein
MQESALLYAVKADILNLVRKEQSIETSFYQINEHGMKNLNELLSKLRSFQYI